MRRLPRGALLACALLGCAAPLPPPPKGPPPPPPPPLVRQCQEALPLQERTVGELVRLVRAMAAAFGGRATIATRPCDATTSWPIAFAESGEGRAPIGMTVLRMEGDALLSFDASDREAPSVKLCVELDAKLDDRHRVRAIALWPSDDEKAFDPNRLEASRAEVAWLEVLSRAPSACALGQREQAGTVGEDELGAMVRCARFDYVTPPREGCDLSPPIATDAPSAEEVERSAARVHRFTFEGRTSVRDGELELARPERCLYEPPPATHDVCLASYRRAGHPDEKWYGRGDATRTGTNGQKNYVDSYLTLQMLRRLEAERRRQLPPAATPGVVPASAPSSQPPR